MSFPLVEDKAIEEKKLSLEEKRLDFEKQKWQEEMDIRRKSQKDESMTQLMKVALENGRSFDDIKEMIALLG